MRVLITGTAGFIGFHLANRLLDAGHIIAGLDGLTPYYDVTLKEARHAKLAQSDGFTPYIVRLEDESRVGEMVEATKPEIVFHLAAQAGVRYSLENPRSYLESNVTGTFNLLEALRHNPPQHLIFASTSSVYGADGTMPFVEKEAADHPLTIYAATKKAGELMAHNYAHLWNIPTTAVRFFTVYGPWGRPDMALFRFVDAMIKGQPIDVYNHGNMLRDFTYIDDLVEAMVRLMNCVPSQSDGGEILYDSLSPVAPYRLVNIGRGSPVALLDFIAAVEASLGKKAIRNMMPMQTGDVCATFASADLLKRLTGFQPETPLEEGVDRFVEWYRAYYKR